MKKLFYLAAFIATIFCINTFMSCSQDDELDYCNQQPQLQTKASGSTNRGGEISINNLKKSVKVDKQQTEKEKTISTTKEYVFRHRIRKWNPNKGICEWENMEVRESFTITYAYNPDNFSGQQTETTTGRCISVVQNNNNSGGLFANCLYLICAPSNCTVYRSGQTIHICRDHISLSLGTNYYSDYYPSTNDKYAIGKIYNYKYETVTYNDDETWNVISNQ